ncbi:TIGR03564 family F420-dependent LLM class oxidoreductase [Candidatus Poriferisocius sp.]|uniref:TIGR03564 family F420-dependent LLM class oxidoreductase n=1 Tax=Candidatus Poriferisocius sp. TaxID=3101276 RepID=UPI003B029E67
MRIGLMVGPERRRYATKTARMIEAAKEAEAGGFASVWIPQIPDEFDAMTSAALIGSATSSVEVGTAVVVAQTRHPIALCQQLLSVQLACEGRFTLGLGPSHHWIVEDMLGLTYDRPAALVRSYLDVLDRALAGPGPVLVENEHFHINNPLDITDQAATPVLLAALGPVMLRLAGARTDGTVLWLADERAIGEFIAPRINRAAVEAGRPPPRIVAGVPVCLCAPGEVDAAKGRAERLLAEAEVSPNYQRLLDRGDAQGVSDIMAVGDEAAVLARLRSFADAGVTDISVRVLPVGDGRDELIASSQRTREFLASLTPGI